MNIPFYKQFWFFILISAGLLHTEIFAAVPVKEPIKACMIPREAPLTPETRAQIASCLGWVDDPLIPLCQGSYRENPIIPFEKPETIRVVADNVSFYSNQRSTLKGHVQVSQQQSIISAQTAYIYRDAKTNQVTKIILLQGVRYTEPDKTILAQRAELHPLDRAGRIDEAIYRLNVARGNLQIPAWGRAKVMQRFANNNYWLKNATYTTCAPKDNAWSIEANSLWLDDAKKRAVARGARLKVRDKTLLYVPYLSFPTTKERKTGFLAPMVGYSNIGGLVVGQPFYWNLAPNYDLTLYPRAYSERGVMLGGEYRYLGAHSHGFLNGNFLPNDHAYGNFLRTNAVQFPLMQNRTTNRWSYNILDTRELAPNLVWDMSLQQVSDDYYLQDFHSNLALLTQRQLLKQAALTYTTNHWIMRGMGQSYQTLHPINETPIANVYQRVPQLMAQGFYADLPANLELTVLGQYDQFHWPINLWDSSLLSNPEGPRFHLNPILSLPLSRPWAYMTPSVQFVENYYAVQQQYGYYGPQQEYNRFIPRYSVDGGLFFERSLSLLHNPIKQTLEPRLFYLRVPYRNQTSIPVYDSGNMLFNIDQLFRTNRFSGFDRIGDANQLAFALTTRFLSDVTGAERASLSVGQIRYFAHRQVPLCYNLSGYCVDSPDAFGALSPTSKVSPIASRGVLYVHPLWAIAGEYMWDPVYHSTNNADLNLRYQPDERALASFGYSYLVNGDMTQVSQRGTENNALHQAIAAFAWPLTDRWSTVGAYSHNISKNYSMMSLAGLQYDSCCWAARIVGGRIFQSLNGNFRPQYNNNVYFQVQLKGLGSVATSDPGGALHTYIPGYQDPFRG